MSESLNRKRVAAWRNSAQLLQRVGAYSLRMATSPIEFGDERLRLTIPLSDAVSFAMGWSDLGFHEPAEHLRQVVGILAIDVLQQAEEWRLASMLQRCLALSSPALQPD